MKKLILSSLALLAAVTTVKAQSDYPTWSFGPKAGLNVSSIVGASEYTDMKPRAGFVAGVFGEYRPLSWMGVGVEVLYSAQGANESFSLPSLGNSATVEGTNHYKLDYINVPILAKFYPVKGLSLNIGIQPGIKVSSKIKSEGGSPDSPFYNETHQFWRETRNIDWAIPMGVTYNFDFGLVLDARYAISVNSILKPSQTLDAMKGSNSVFSFTVGWRF